MKKRHFLGLLYFISHVVFALPTGFVYLKDIDASIVEELRYAGSYNFVGRPIKGYRKNICILTEPAARALSRVQKELRQSGFSLKVYDCYRPKMAVDDFVEWSKDGKHQEMKLDFYPNVNKSDFFKLGYVARQSSHSRGSTIDLTIISLGQTANNINLQKSYSVPCTAPYAQRSLDNSIDMGTSFDCMDVMSNVNNFDISPIAKQHRTLLQNVMMRHGFKPYDKEWWHFTYKRESFGRYYNFFVS